jgi:hypothetical protein
MVIYDLKLIVELRIHARWLQAWDTARNKLNND